MQGHVRVFSDLVQGLVRESTESKNLVGIGCAAEMKIIRIIYVE